MSATTVVSDTFTRADSAVTLGSAEVGGAWTALDGTWGISSNQAYTPTPGTVGVALVTTTVSDCTVTVTTATVVADNGIIVRLTDVSNFVRAIFEGGTWFIQKNVAASFTTIASVAGANSNGDIIALKASGNNYTLTLNGSVILTGSDAFNATAVKHGLTSINSTGRFDNFRITVP